MMITKSPFKQLALLAILTFAISSCGEIENAIEDAAQSCTALSSVGTQDSRKIKSEVTLSEGDCYTIEESPVIKKDAHLTIEPGVELKFEENQSFTVSSAKLTAKGTAENPIVFTGTEQEPGWWTGIEVHNTRSSDNVLEHVQIKYAGSDETPDSVSEPAALMFDNQWGNIEFDLQNVTVSNSGGFGLYAEKNVTLDNSKNTFKNNNSGAATIHPSIIRDLASSSSFTENNKDFVAVWGGKVKADAEQTWPAIGVPYRVTGNLTVKKTGKVKVQPGARFEFVENKGLTLTNGGPFVFEGNADNEIVFTGVESNAGFWTGIQVQNTTKSGNAFKHVAIEYAGGDETYDSVRKPAALAFDNQWGKVEFDLENVTISHSGGFGLYAEKDVSLDNSKNTFTKNTSGAARIHPARIRNLDSSSSFTGNDKDFVSVWKGKVKADADQTWPAIDVPYRMTGHLTVKKTGEVKIEPGANFEFAENKGLTLKNGGPFVVEGKAEDKIVFTGVESNPGFWPGIQIENTTKSGNTFKHVSIKYAGSSETYDNVKEPAALAFDNQWGKVEFDLENVTLANSGGFGLYAEQDVSLDNSENTFTKNKSGAATIHPARIRNLDGTSSFTGNDKDFVAIWGGDVTADAEQTWPAIDVPYRMTDSVRVQKTGKVTINAGARFEFAENTGLTLTNGGPFVIEGTSEDNIVFTGVDSTAGFWSGIQIQNTTHSENMLKHVAIEYAGSSETFDSCEPANLMLDNQWGKVKFGLQNVTLTNSGGFGLYAEDDVELTSCDVSISGTATSAVGGNTAAITQECGL